MPRLLPFILALAIGVVAHAAEYYVSADGDDVHAGTSPQQAWRTIGRVNRYAAETGFLPGDRIRFRGGDTFDDAVLHIVNSGAPGQPIVFESFGRGRAHLTRRGVEHHQIIGIVDQCYITLDNLEISSPDFDPRKTTRGIGIEFTTEGEYGGITIRNCHIHDIHGGLWHNRHLRGGIWMRTRSHVRGVAVGLLIENNRIERIHSRGIHVGGQNRDSFHRDVVIRNNYVDNTGQAGILISHVAGGRIEGNTVYRAGNYYPPGDQAGVLAACWAANSRDVVIQFNEVAHTRLGDTSRPDGNLNEQSHDSQAFDIDVGAPGWHLIQYNYTHDNEGGFMLWMGRPGPQFERAIVRYNLSINDGRGFRNRLFELHSHADDAAYPVAVRHNTFINSERIWLNNRAPKQDRHRGWVFENNIFYAPQIQFDDQTSIVYRNNLYFPAAPPPADPAALHADPMFLGPVCYGDGLPTARGCRISPASPAARAAIDDSLHRLRHRPLHDLWGNPLPPRRAIGAHEP